MGPGIQGILHGFQQALGDFIFHPEGEDGVAGQGFGCRFLVQRLAENSHMQVAQALDLAHRYAFADHGPFGFSDLAGSCPADGIAEFFLQIGHTFAGMQPLDHFFQRFFALACVVDMLAHRVLH